MLNSERGRERFYFRIKQRKANLKCCKNSELNACTQIQKYSGKNMLYEISTKNIRILTFLAISSYNNEVQELSNKLNVFDILFQHGRSGMLQTDP